MAVAAMRSRITAIGLTGLLCVSCLPVPFDLSLSKAAALTAKMTKDNPSLISAGGYDEGGSRTDQAFYPSVLATGGFDYSAGFATVTDGLSVDVNGIADGSQYASQNAALTNPDPNAKPYLLWPLKVGVSYLFGTSFDMVDPMMNGYGIFRGTPPGTLTLSGNGYESLLGPDLPFASMVIGASVTADPSPAFDRLHLLIQDASSLPSQYFAEGSFELSGADLTVSPFTALRGTASYALPFIAAGTTRVMYYYDEPTGRSFASLFNAATGGWVCYAWDDTSTYRQLPITHRIDALLSTGELLSTEDGTARLYDRNGALLARFDLGNLVYMAEEYVGGEARCYFSQALPYGGTLHFNVYWIPTARLASLGS
jgi:hypothetical protein